MAEMDVKKTRSPYPNIVRLITHQWMDPGERSLIRSKFTLQRVEFST